MVITIKYFFRFCSKKAHTDQKKYMFYVIQSYISNTVFLNICLYARDYCVLNIGSLIVLFNPDPIEDYMNGVRIIVSNEQSTLMLPMNNSPISMRNNLEANESEGFVVQHSILKGCTYPVT